MDQADADIPPPPEPTQLVVFADDWGRHPSSSQHLIKQLLPQYPTLWVNTIGTRKPSLSLADLSRAVGVVANWFVAPTMEQGQTPPGLEILKPIMYPGFRRSIQRRFNARQVARSIQRKLQGHARKVAITTLPITADLVGHLQIDRWIYYCVDDYSQWPGADHGVMDAMERALVSKVDEVVCVSDTLGGRVNSLGRDRITLLPHGVEMELWQRPAGGSIISNAWPDTPRPVALFWGLIDERLDNTWADRICSQAEVDLVLAGPQQYTGRVAHDARPSYHLLGPIPFADLPAHAAKASVLVMPYIDAPVTRAMQPLKLLEYLATMKPVVVRDLPSTRAWADCCDLASDAETFAKIVSERAKTGTPPAQLEARRRRLPSESWTAKAAQLASIINA